MQIRFCRNENRPSKSDSKREITSSATYEGKARHEATHLLLLVQHDVGFKAGNARELFMANGAGEVRRGVRGLVQCEVELHVECLRALLTSMRLQVKEKSTDENKKQDGWRQNRLKRRS